MSLHNIISNKITSFLNIFYYNNLKKIYNESIDNIFKLYKFPVIKPEYFVFFQYYFIYKTLYYITCNKIIYFSLSLHLIYICGLIFENLIELYKYCPQNNIYFLKNTGDLLFLYLFFLKICFLRIFTFKKILMLTMFSIFYFLYSINYIYKERLKYIELKKDFIHPLKILIISPNKKFILNVIKKTDFFTYNNFLFFINFIMLILND
jgi:hypothetical protein